MHPKREHGVRGAVHEGGEPGCRESRMGRVK